MFSEYESVGAQKARERRDKYVNMLLGACWTLGAFAILCIIIAVSREVNREPPQPAALQGIRQSQLDNIMAVCSQVQAKECADKHVISCQRTINGRVVCSSRAC